MGEFMQFRDLKVGDKFNFAGDRWGRSFVYDADSCIKTGPHSMEWAHGGRRFSSDDVSANSGVCRVAA